MVPNGFTRTYGQVWGYLSRKYIDRRIPIDLGLIFPFASSVLVSEREQPEHPEYALSQLAHYNAEPILALLCAPATVSLPNFA